MHLRLHRLLGTVLVACVAALGMLLAFGPAVGASTVGASPSAQAAAAARAALDHLSIGWHSNDQRVPGRAAGIKGLSQVESSNWSGYADTGSGFSSVTGKWTEPSATCTSTTSLAAFWVGIDGYSSDTVEQDGTLVECYEGTAYYYTWWEMYPSNDIQVVGETLEPGDSISASVVRSGTSYTLDVTDSTNPANSFTTTQTCSCANSSAEWIAEAPSGSSGIYPLADFSSFSPWDGTVKEGSTSGVISSFTDDAITMVDSAGHIEAKPGALNTAGKEFTITWKRST
jgi:Peptidase A4 family